MKTCLVVDDETSIRTYVMAILAAADFRVLEAADAKETLKLVHGLQGRLDLIVTDIRMPGDMDGLDLAYAVRDTFPAIPIILMSGFTTPELRQDRYDDFAFIAKPFRPAAMLEVVKMLEARRESTDEMG